MKRFAAGAALAASAILVLAQPALASWQQENTPVPAGSVWQFSAVSCTTSSSCVAVGSVDSTLLAETRGSGGWTIVPIPDPGGGQLSGISCTGSVCEAVGSFDNGTMRTLAEVWNGSTWSVQSTPNPAGATSSQLSGISCRSASACEAVGQFSNGSATQTLAEVWNGSTWTIQSTPNASGQAASQLNGVTCPQTTACEAVGSSNTGPTFATLAEVWNGSTWTIQPTPNGPGGKAVNQLGGVSCFGATACTATGDGFAERWNGTSWTLQAIASAHGNTPADLGRVWCTAADFCIAVGTFFDKEAIEQAVAEDWTGSKWALLDTPISSTFDSSGLSDVSCTFATACIGVGFYHDPVDGNRTLAENWSLRWLLQPPAIPPSALASSLQTVSCPNSTARFSLPFCAAVGGDEESGSVFNAIAETWTGKAWQLGTVPNASNSNLSGVSCTGAKACTAVGDVSSGGSLLTLALRWNGTSWTVQATPNPAGAVSSFLTSVSCPSATACTAVGFWRDSMGNQTPFAEQWNGTTWTLHTTPSASGNPLSQLNGVSCAAANACEAVGSDNTGTWADVWNGTSWRVQSTPTPAGGRNPFLNGVSCAAANACTAVGDYFNGTKTVPLAERWNGSGWTAQTPAVPPGSASGLSGVSCHPSAPGCWVSGFVTKSGVTTPLVEGWDGMSWSLHATPSPDPNVTRSNMSSVSCASRTACMGVGFYDTSTGAENPLGEQLS